MNDDMSEMEIEDTRPQRAQEVDDRLQQLRSELEVNGRLNAALARAAGLDAVDIPEDLLREIDEAATHVRNAGPLSPADLPVELRRELEARNDRREPPTPTG